MTPELIQAMMMGQGPQQQKLDRQSKMIEKMRGQLADQAQPQPFGRLVMPNVPGTIMNAVGNIALDRRQGGLDQQQAALGAQQDQNRRGYLDQLMMAMRRQLPQSGQPALPPDGMEDR